MKILLVTTFGPSLACQTLKALLKAVLMGDEFSVNPWLLYIGITECSSSFQNDIVS